MKVVTPDNFKATIEGMLQDDYYESVVKASKEVIPKVARKAAQKLKDASPKRTGKYASGWSTKTEKGRISISSTIYGKHGTYQLAHLLEHGHAKRNGGRTQAIEHIKPVEDWAIDEAYQGIIRKVEGMP